MTGETRPPNLQELLGRVHALVERNRFDQARSLVVDALRHFPDDVQLLYYATFTAWAQDNLDESDRHLRQLIQLDPTHHGGRIQLARLLTGRKDLAGAERIWIELLRDNPEDADLYGEYAELMLNAIWIIKALDLAAEGLKYEPEHEHCRYVIALAKIVYGERADADAALATLLKEHPERLRTAYALVVALESKGRYKEAYRVSQQVLRANPASPEWLHNVRIFKAASHWSMLPLYPFQRWGWGASIALWLVVILGMKPLSIVAGEGAAMILLVSWLLFVIYSWAWPPILRKIV